MAKKPPRSRTSKDKEDHSIPVLTTEDGTMPHALTGQYLRCIGSREDDMNWWCCKPGATQTREHLFKVCTTWEKQKILWKAVRAQTKRGRGRFRSISSQMNTALRQYSSFWSQPMLEGRLEKKSGSKQAVALRKSRRR